jgi:hypothetical protein
MSKLARNLIILGLALGVWGISFVFIGDSNSDDPTQKVCHAHLDQIQRAKQKWAAENHKDGNALPTVDDLKPYFPNQRIPQCPGLGVYAINAVADPPHCSITTHTYP